MVSNPYDNIVDIQVCPEKLVNRQSKKGLEFSGNSS